MAPNEYKMDTVKHHARSLLELKVLFVINEYGCNPSKGGLHCSNDTEGVGGPDFNEFIDKVVDTSRDVLYNLVDDLKIMWRTRSNFINLGYRVMSSPNHGKQ